VKNAIYARQFRQIPDDVMLDEREVLVTVQGRNILNPTCNQIVQTNDGISVSYQASTQVGADKSSTTSHEDDQCSILFPAMEVS